jgi:hypothetical protein
MDDIRGRGTWARRRSDGELTPAEGEFAGRIAPTLRAMEPVPPDFEARVMREVRASGGLGRDSASWKAPRWWARRYPMALSPIEGLALAAGFALIVTLGALGATGGGDGAARVASAAARVDTVYLVRFAITAPGAGRVSLVGGFNGWSRETTALEASDTAGLWWVTVPLPAGRHEYAFVIDGEQWLVDPLANRVADEFGVESSVLRVGGSS